MDDALKRKRGGGSAVPYVRNSNQINKIKIKLLDLCSADKSLGGWGSALSSVGVVGKPFAVGLAEQGSIRGGSVFLEGMPELRHR